MNEQEVSIAEIDGLHEKLSRGAEAGGYHLNPDVEFAKWLVKSLVLNERRYGYRACPCRLATGNRQDDLDIICPCDYRDPDLIDYGVCYCALYVSDVVAKGEKRVDMIPERRPPPEQRTAETVKKGRAPAGLALPVWRCKVCGYLCAREQAPELCPICKAGKDQFERFM